MAINIPWNDIYLYKAFCFLESSPEYFYNEPNYSGIKITFSLDKMSRRSEESRGIVTFCCDAAIDTHSLCSVTPLCQPRGYICNGVPECNSYHKNCRSLIS